MAPQSFAALGPQGKGCREHATKAGIERTEGQGRLEAAFLRSCSTRIRESTRRFPPDLDEGIVRRALRGFRTPA